MPNLFFMGLLGSSLLWILCLMINPYMNTILYITGAVTSSMILQFLAPKLFLKMTAKISISDEKTVFFAQAVGLAIAMVGILLMWAGYDASIRFPVLVIAIIGKLGFVFLLIKNFKTFAKGYLGTMIFDLVCVFIFAYYLISNY